jgi:hypothetical protein
MEGAGGWIALTLAGRSVVVRSASNIRAMTYGSRQVKDWARPSGKQRFVPLNYGNRWPRSLWWATRPDAATGVATMLDVLGNPTLVDRRRLDPFYDRLAIHHDALTVALDCRRAWDTLVDDREELPEQQTLFELDATGKARS